MNELQVKDKNYEKTMQTIDHMAAVTTEVIANLGRVIGERFDGLETKLSAVEKEVIGISDRFSNLPLQGADIDQITNAKNKKIVSLLGGKDSPAYRNAKDKDGKCIRSRAYSDIMYQINREFGVSSYKYIRTVNTPKVLEYIAQYTLPTAIKEEVDRANWQG